MLEVRNLSAGYGSIEVLRDTSLTVGAGELVGLVGHNGAGKSTTLKAIAGVVPVRSGSISWLDEPLSGSPASRIRHGIAYVPEDRRIFTQLTVAENLQLGATVRTPADRETAIERELERFPVLRKYYRRRSGDLSGGEQQMLAIGRALVSDPRLLVLDEPTLGLAPIIVDDLFRTIVALRDEGTTILLVEQNVAKTLRVADRAYVMEPGGRITFGGAARELAENPTFRADYLHRGDEETRA